MNKSLLILLLFISSLISTSCLTTKGFQKEKTSSEEFNLEAPLEKGYKVASYKAEIDVAGRHFSGIFWFKNIGNDTYRMVLLSELGLNLLDLELKGDTFKTISCQEFINKDIIINSLKNDLKLLFKIPDAKTDNYVSKNSENLITLYKIKDNLKRYYYFCNSEKKIEKITFKKGFSQLEVLNNDFSKKIPKEIIIDHKRFNLNIKLNLLKVK